MSVTLGVAAVGLTQGQETGRRRQLVFILHDLYCHKHNYALTILAGVLADDHCRLILPITKDPRSSSCSLPPKHSEVFGKHLVVFLSRPRSLVMLPQTPALHIPHSLGAIMLHDWGALRDFHRLRIWLWHETQACPPQVPYKQCSIYITVYSQHLTLSTPSQLPKTVCLP